MATAPDVAQRLGLIGESPGIVAVRDTIRRLLPRLVDTNRPPALLIQGETGTGKGILARAIHRVSPRREGPFVDVNCAAIPETLLEAELFGYERGAFTDARHDKAGLFQAAHRGSLFLDELGLLPPSLQGKLLTVIEDRAVRRLGSTRSEPVDVWILAATSSDLEAAMSAGRFHDALYHRLTVLKLWLPPLRERGADVTLLAEHFLARACHDHGLAPKRLHDSARAALVAYSWPGNVRELINVMERVALLEESSIVTADMLGLVAARPIRASATPDSSGRLRERVAGLEREEIAEALRQSRGNITHAATHLGIPANTLRYRIEKHGLSPRAVGAARGRSRARRPREAPGPSPGAASGVIRWESRLVAVLRATLEISTGMAALPETARPMHMLLDKVASFGGRVEELAPSTMVAAFGIEPIEDAPRRAALAARAIQAALTHARRESAFPWSARLALHVESFLISPLGDGGPALDLDAKRRAWAVLDALVAAAEPEGVFLSADAARLLDRRFDLTPIGSIDGAGSVLRLGGGERAGLGLHGQLTRFTGRGEELGLLRERMAIALTGQGQAVAIAGEPGIGKSRLLFELRQQAEAQGMRYLEGRCVPHGRLVPYLPFADVARQLFGITDGDSAAALVDKVRRGIAGLGLDPRERVPFALAVLGAAAEDEAVALRREAGKARIVATLRQLLVAVSWQRPLVLAVEDIHWSDPESAGLLEALASAPPAAPVLLVTTYRSGQRPPWVAGTAAVEIALEPLSREDSLAVLRSALGTVDVPDTLAEVVLARAEGNPFFLEELTRAVMENPALTMANAAPITIQEILLGRINRLSEEDRILLQCAAVIGKDVPLALLEAVSGLATAAIGASVARLTEARFLREGAVPAEPGYAFKHVLTQEAVYSTLGVEERRRLHRRALEAIEDAYPGRLTERLDQLAHHVVRGEVWDKALRYLREPGELSRVGDRPNALGGSPQWAAGEHVQAVQRAEADLRITHEYMNFVDQVVAHLQLGQAYHSQGANRQAVEVLSRNVTMLEGAPSLQRFRGVPGLLAVLSRGWLAVAHAELGEFREAEARAGEAMAIAGGAGAAYDRAVAGWAVGTVALLRGDAETAVAELYRARSCARECSALEALQLIEAPLGLALAQATRLDEARAAFEGQVVVPETQPLLADQARRVAWRAEAERLAGRLDSADALARSAVDMARARGERGHEAHALATLAAVAVDRDRSDTAATEASYRQSLALAEELEMHPLAARCRTALAVLGPRGV